MAKLVEFALLHQPALLYDEDPVELARQGRSRERDDQVAAAEFLGKRRRGAVNHHAPVWRSRGTARELSRGAKGSLGRPAASAAAGP